MMDLARYLTALTKLFHRFCYDQIGKKCLILVRGEISKRQLSHFFVVTNIRS